MLHHIASTSDGNTFGNVLLGSQRVQNIRLFTVKSVRFKHSPSPMQKPQLKGLRQNQNFMHFFFHSRENNIQFFNRPHPGVVFTKKRKEKKRKARCQIFDQLQCVQ